MNEERALTYENGITDIYSNSWGPYDSGDSVAGPGRLTKLALQNGAREVCTFASCFLKLQNISSIPCRAVMEKVQYLCGLMVMEDLLMMVRLMGIQPASTASLLVPLE